MILIVSFNKNEIVICIKNFDNKNHNIATKHEIYMKYQFLQHYFNISILRKKISRKQYRIIKG